MPPESIPKEVRLNSKPRSEAPVLILAIDFGTTNTCVSYVSINSGEDRSVVGLARVVTIRNYPQDQNHGNTSPFMRREVPTELRYPGTDTRFRQECQLDHHRRPAKSISYDEPVSSGSDTDDDYDAEAAVAADDAEIDYSFIGAPDGFKWGYEVHEARSSRRGRDENWVISCFKLLLDDSPVTAPLRHALAPILQRLKQKRIIKSQSTIFADFFTYLLRHIKNELNQEGLYQTHEIEIVLTIPAIWSQKASREMHTSLVTAMETARFKGSTSGTIENLFLVSEPEAAAAFQGDVFVLLDCGGGTIDANTYVISQTEPLRLKSEVVPPSGESDLLKQIESEANRAKTGGLFGSNFLNVDLKQHLVRRLQGETYLEDDRVTIKSIAEKIVWNEFESYPIPVRGLGADGLFFVSNILKKIFLGRLKPIRKLMEDQIKSALQKGYTVNKVILIGGFVSSPSLRTYLQRQLEKEFSGSIKVVYREDCITAVSSDAVLRSLNKADGPKRFARSSYGILRRETKGDHPEHAGFHGKWDPVDRFSYIPTIDWILKRDETREVPSVWISEPIVCYHTFDAKKTKHLVCEEVLYVSDQATRSHYPVMSRPNKDAQKVGTIEADWTFLITDNLIQPEVDVHDADDSDRGAPIGVPHYKVRYTMVLKVVDRDLQCYAYYDGKVVVQCQINIASAFAPGVN
ncbi:hypothetical protein F4778DRAFT_780375 [Xylariomycetidae sp. FL2044]|nr:hypothetical protein F4778DRAFT_780375 [Xylariomycetidae sp. FL2044]